MQGTLTERLISDHLVEGKPRPGAEIGLAIDQTLTQDATGTMVYLEFESLGMDRVQPETAVSYIDHNIIQTDYKNADDHRFLQSAAAKYGVTLSPAGNGVSHHVHRQRFGIPGKTLLGSDSHTTTGGCLSMLAMGAGGLEVAMAMAGRPYYINTPEVWGIYLEGELEPFVSGKDVILELLRRYTVKGGVGTVMEFYGPGVSNLDFASRATIANMAVDIGATAAVFPSDEVAREFLRMNGREEVWEERITPPDAEFEYVTELDLAGIEPLVACPSNPDNVKPARELSDVPVHQVIIGSSCNGSYRDFMIAALMVDGKMRHPEVSFEINTGSRQTLVNLMVHGGLEKLVGAGARTHEPGCLGCIGMGQAPASGTNSLRTFPRNFKGRSGTKDDAVYLSSPETAAASAINGYITDPRTFGECPVVEYPERFAFNDAWFVPPAENPEEVEIVRGPNIKTFPDFEALPEELRAEVILQVGDNISTDTIMPAGNRVLPYRSNIPAISGFVFDQIDAGFPERARSRGNGIVVGGHNYGQGSSREHAALAPRYLGIRAKIAKSFARIHKANLINFGVLPLVFEDPEEDYPRLSQGTVAVLPELRDRVARGDEQIPLRVDGREVMTRLEVSPRHRRMLLAGGALNLVKRGE
ncbi:MAG: aconitate hydratase [Spirochaetaceae bacterium]